MSEARQNAMGSGYAITLSGQPRCLRGCADSRAGFSLVEMMTAVAVCLISLGTILLLNSQQLRLVKSARESNAASLLLQDRIEQFRTIRTWLHVTDATSLSDTYLATRPASAVMLPGLSERVIVEAWPDPGVTNSILIEYPASGSPIVLRSGPNMVHQKQARVELQVMWTGKDGRPRKRAYATVVSNSGVTRTNLPGFGGFESLSTPAPATPTPVPADGQQPAPTPAASTPTPLPATPTPAPPGNSKKGKGKGTAGGQSGIG